MTIVVCDASPLIFLAKLDRLGLISPLLGEDVVVLQCVADEVLGPAGHHNLEQGRLRDFLLTVRIVDFTDSTQRSVSLSESDRRSLAYAVSHRVAWLVADERLLRRIARHEGIATIGTLGLLVAAAKRGLLTRRQAMDDVDAAISSHQFRISIALYQQVQRELLG